MKQAKEEILRKSAPISYGNTVTMDFSYEKIDTICSCSFYVLCNLGIPDRNGLTSEFIKSDEPPLVQYLNCKGKPFFSSSTYYVGKGDIHEIDMHELEKITFMTPLKPLYFCDLKDFMRIYKDQELKKQLVSKRYGAQIIVVDGIVYHPTPTTMLIVKDYNIQTGV